MIVEIAASLFDGIPSELAVFFMAALPVLELRGAIPAGLEVWGLGPIVVYVLAISGNLLPFFPLFYGLEALRKWMAKHTPRLVRWMDRYIESSRKKLERKYNAYGFVALFLFTAIPLPLTGLYSATVAAVALKLPLRSTFLAITSGVLCSGIIVTLLTVGISALTTQG